MKPYYEQGKFAVYHADAAQGLCALSGESVDLICTSPPYNCRKEYGDFGDQVAWPDYYELMFKVITESHRILVLGGTMAINVPTVVRWQAEHVFANTWSDYDADYKSHRNGEYVTGKGRIEPLGFRLFEMMERVGFRMREPVVWVKGSEGNAISSDYRMGCDSDPYMRPAHEMILLGSKGRWFHRGGTGRRGKDAVPFLDETKDVWFIPPESDRDHPAVFPRELPSRLIRLFTHAADSVVCDPFCGRGTTLDAAKGLGRNAIGIDANERYCRITANRLRQDALQFA